MSDDGPTILVVDDEPHIVDLYADQLATVGSVRKAYGGEEALEEIDEGVDLVLLDRRMPDQAGDEVLEAIREAGYDPITVMVTAVQPDFDVVDLPFDDYLVKPVRGEELRDLATSMLDRDSYRETARQYFALASKRATLEEHKHPQELRGNEAYRRLEEELETVRRRADDSIEELTADSLERLFEELQSE